MSDKNRRVSVSILDKDYQVACQPEEKAALLLAATELDSRMRKARLSGNLVGIERIAVVVALNLCHELLQTRSADADSLSPQLEQLLQKLQNAQQ
jgi:cell division protein ZapA